MRIRKNAKNFPLRYPTSSPNPGAVIQTHFCQLNQSPWDVMNFALPISPSPPRSPPPPPSQVDRKDIRPGKECLVENVPIVERPSILCSKANGKGWQCQRKATNENSLCDHHLSLGKNYILNEFNKTLEAHDRSRRKKTSTISPCGPNEFYYYSGFGPWWGKRRGESSSENINRSDMSQNVEHGHELSPALLSQFDDEDIDSDSEAEDESEKREKRRKRGRKPIKERPLKSLV